MPIQLNVFNSNNLIDGKVIGLGNQFNPIEGLFGGTIVVTPTTGDSIWNRSVSGIITSKTSTDALSITGNINGGNIYSSNLYSSVLSLQNGLYFGNILTETLNATRSYLLPNKDGTIAMLSDTQMLPNYALLSQYTKTNFEISNVVILAHSHLNLTLLNSYDQTNLNIVSAISLKHSHPNIVFLDSYNFYNADVLSAISYKHQHTNFVLLQSYTQTNIEINNAVNLAHSHSNLTLLQTYTNANNLITTVISHDHQHTNLSLLETYTQSNINITEAITSKHSHINLVLLETYTQSEINIGLAVSLKHSHANINVLDGIINTGLGNQYLSDDGYYKTISIGNVGANTQILYNESGLIVGSSGLVFNSTSNTITTSSILVTSDLQIGNGAVRISNMTNNLVFTDSFYTKTLSQLVSGAINYWDVATGGINYPGFIGINTPAAITAAITVNGNINADYFDSNFFRYKNSNILIGPNAGNLDTGINKIIIANTDTATPVFYAEMDNQLINMYADVYILGPKTLNFGSATNRIYKSITTNDLSFQDGLANGGSPITLSMLRDGSFYSLVSAYTDHNSVLSITAGNKTTWNKASILITGGLATSYLAADGVYRPVSGGGVTPTDNFSKWDVVASHYRFYTTKTEAGGGASAGKLYSGTLDPSANNRLNYDGALWATNFNSINAFSTGTAGSGIVFNSVGQYSATIASNVRTNFNPNTVTGSISPSYFFDTSTLQNTIGDILFKVANYGTSKFTIDKDGNVNIPTGSTYQINGIPISSGGGVTPISDLLYWDGLKYSPYSTYTLNSFYFGLTNPSSIARLNLDYQLYASKIVSIGDINSAVLNSSGTTQTTGYFDNGVIAPIQSNRLNYNGTFYASGFYGTGSIQLGTTSNNLTVSSDSIIRSSGSGSIYISPGVLANSTIIGQVNIGHIGYIGNTIRLQTAGSLPNISLSIQPKGLGSIKLGSGDTSVDILGSSNISLDLTVVSNITTFGDLKFGNSRDSSISGSSGISGHLTGYSVFVQGGTGHIVGNNNGGDVILTGGSPVNTGKKGNVLIVTGSSSINSSIGGVLKDFYTDVSTSGDIETGLYSFIIPPYTLYKDGDKLIIEVNFDVTTSPTSSIIKVYFAEVPYTLLTGVTLSNYLSLKFTIIRVSSSVARISLIGVTAAGSTLPVVSEMTSKNWLISNILRVTGQCATNSITAKFGYIEYKPAGVN